MNSKGKTRRAAESVEGRRAGWERAGPRSPRVTRRPAWDEPSRATPHSWGATPDAAVAPELRPPAASLRALWPLKLCGAVSGCGLRDGDEKGRGLPRWACTGANREPEPGLGWANGEPRGAVPLARSSGRLRRLTLEMLALAGRPWPEGLFPPSLHFRCLPSSHQLSARTRSSTTAFRTFPLHPLRSYHSLLTFSLEVDLEEEFLNPCFIR